MAASEGKSGFEILATPPTNTIYLHLQETYGYQTRQGAGLLAPTLKAINLKKLNLFHKAFGY